MSWFQAENDLTKSYRAYFLPLIALALAAAAFWTSQDPTALDLRGRHYASWLRVGGGWGSVELRPGRTAVKSRVQNPRLRILFRNGDTYRLQFFYVLEGSAPADVLIQGKKAGVLPPGKGIQDASVTTPRLSPLQNLEVAFRVPEGARLTIDRVRYRNHFFRLSSFFLIKPAGGTRGKSGAADVFVFAGGLFVLFAAYLVMLRRRAVPLASAQAPFWTAGAIAAALLAAPLFLPVAFHIRPGFLNFIFWGAAAVSMLITFISRTSTIGFRGWAARGAAALAGLALSLLIVEGLLRVIDSPFSQPKLRGYTAYSPYYGWVNRPGVSGWQVGLGFHVRINRYGHRGPEMPIEKKKGVIRILGLGDSFTFGWGVEEDKTFLAVMAAGLRKAGYRVEVFNAGVPGWGIAHSLAYLLRDGVRFRPDLVVFTLFTDDFFVSTIEQILKSPAARQNQEEDRKFLVQKKNIWRSLRLNNVWFNYIRKILLAESYKRRNPFANFKKEREVSKRNFDRDPALVRAFTEKLGEWRAARGGLGIPVILSYIPFGGALHHPDYQGEARLLKRLSREMAFPYLDVLSMFEKEKNPRSLYFHPVDNHATVKGHRLMGEALARIALEKSLLKKTGKKPVPVSK